MGIWRFVGEGLATAIIVAVIFKVYRKMKEGGEDRKGEDDVFQVDELNPKHITDWFEEYENNEKGSAHYLIYATEGQVSVMDDKNLQKAVEQLKKKTGLFKDSSDFIIQVVYNTEEKKIKKYRIVIFKSVDEQLNGMFEDADFYRKRIIEID